MQRSDPSSLGRMLPAGNNAAVQAAPAPRALVRNGSQHTAFVYPHPPGVGILLQRTFTTVRGAASLAALQEQGHRAWPLLADSSTCHILRFALRTNFSVAMGSMTLVTASVATRAGGTK